VWRRSADAYPPSTPVCASVATKRIKFGPVQAKLNAWLSLAGTKWARTADSGPGTRYAEVKQFHLAAKVGDNGGTGSFALEKIPLDRLIWVEAFVRAAAMLSRSPPVLGSRGGLRKQGSSALSVRPWGKRSGT